jgi:type II secretory pathway pseudopilin PulG
MNNINVGLQKKRLTAGFSLVELIVYFSMLGVITVVVISSIISLFKSYSTVKLEQDIEVSALQVFDKLTRDIRDADEIVTSQSSFGVPEGAIALTKIEDATTNTYVYYSASSSIKLSKNGTYLGDLTQPGVFVNKFTAYEILGTSTHALKLEMNLQATPRYGTSTISKNFYTTVQLRNE